MYAMQLSIVSVQLGQHQADQTLGDAVLHTY